MQKILKFDKILIDEKNELVYDEKKNQKIKISTPKNKKMHSFNIFPSQKTDEETSLYFEIILCNNLDQMAEFSEMDRELDDGDTSLFTISKDKDKFLRVATVIFRKDALQLGIINNMCSRMGLTYAQLMTTLCEGDFKNNQEKVDFYENQLCYCSQVCFSLITDYFENHFPEMVY